MALVLQRGKELLWLFPFLQPEIQLAHLLRMASAVLCAFSAALGPIIGLIEMAL